MSPLGWLALACSVGPLVALGLALACRRRWLERVRIETGSDPGAPWAVGDDALLVVDAVSRPLDRPLAQRFGVPALRGALRCTVRRVVDGGVVVECMGQRVRVGVRQLMEVER